MNKTLIIGIIVVIVAAGVGGFYFLNNSDNPWVQTTEFGSLKQEVIITFEDGSTQSLEDLESNNELTFIYNEQEIILVTYNLYGAASGTGYSYLEFDTDNVTGRYWIWTYPNEGTQYDEMLRMDDSSPWDELVQIPLDDEYYLLCSYEMVLEDMFDGLPFSDYKLGFQFEWSVDGFPSPRYRGIKSDGIGDDWVTLGINDRPYYNYFVLDYVDDFTLTLQLEAGKDIN